MAEKTKLGFYEKVQKAFAEMPEKLEMAQGHGYRYTPLPVIMNAIRPILATYGLAVHQEVELSPDTTVEVHKYVSKTGQEREYDTASGFVKVRTILLDGEGERLVSPDLELPIIRMSGNTSAQAIGATITYARRYSLSAFLGLATDEDTDAHSNDSANGSPYAKAESKPQASGGLTQKQIRYINTLSTKSLLEKSLTAMGKKELKDLTSKEGSILIKMLQENFPQPPDSISYVIESILNKPAEETDKAWKSYFKKFDDVEKAEVELLNAIYAKMEDGEAKDRVLEVMLEVQNKGGE